MKAMDVGVYKIPMDAPDDVSQLRKLIKSGEIDPRDIVAIITKTEGNGLVNDFTRGLATMAFQLLLSEEVGIPREDVSKRVALVNSGGCEGVMSPHATVFTRREVEAAGGKEKRLAIGVAFTRDFLPEEIGTMAQVREVAKAVREAMRDAGIEDPRDVHFVQIKCPLLTSERINDAAKRGKSVVTTDTLKSMGYSRGASALGVALALGEVDEGKLNDSVICKDWSLYSATASTSAGIELLNDEIILMGNSTKSVSKYRIGHGVMRDGIDAEGVKEALRSAGLEFECCPSPAMRRRIVNVFAKGGAHPTGRVRDRRTTLLTDSDISSTRHMRAVVSAVIASIVGDPMVYVSGGSEHQGPPGGGPVAAIIEA
ncbi:MAG: ring-opening amidohydrolase [Candidatus Bathyarchaeia archaeon]